MKAKTYKCWSGAVRRLPNMERIADRSDRIGKLEALAAIHGEDSVYADILAVERLVQHAIHEAA